MPRSFEELTPQNFSFNSPLGWCPACEGLGIEAGTDQNAVIANPHLSLEQGALSAFPRPAENPGFLAMLRGLSAEFGVPLDLPWYQLSPRHQRLLLQGTGPREFDVTLPGSPRAIRVRYKGVYPAIEEATRVSYQYRLQLQDMIGERPCSVCQGDRIREDAAAVQLDGRTLPEICRLPLEETLAFLRNLTLTEEQRRIAGDLLNEATHRLAFLVDVGLQYLTLDRGMPTLSGGESQRIRLAGQIGRALTGVLYVLDEPTIGLHPRDNGRLIDALEKLRDLGNTVVLVEHDREVLEAADRLYDFGPGSGRFGGTVVAEGTPRELSQQGKESLTGAYLSGDKEIPIPRQRRMARSDGTEDPVLQMDHLPTTYGPPPGGAWLELHGCRQNNLRDVSLRIPLGTFTCVTGLSGSGKSSLIQDTLARAVARHLRLQGPAPGPFDTISGVEKISRVIPVDQAPLGATPASNPATYTGVFDPIRELFTKLPEAKIRGFKPGRFSFNRPGGRCEDCEGMGQKKIEMHFLPDVWVECETCRGRRYSQETLAVTYKGKSIADVLEMSIGQAQELFENIPKIRAPLATLAAIGLDYLTLGQSATTLSGGEAQRVKLAAELARPNVGRTLYLLDEPTTGLHFDDIAKLLKVLNSLVEQGNTVVVIEHNLDVIKTADWLIDLGPEAGSGGGWIVAAGTPEDVVAQSEVFHHGNQAPKKSGRRKKESGAAPVNPSAERNEGKPVFRSWTGELLAPLLKEGLRGQIEVFNVAEAARKRKGDVDIAAVGRDVPPPWQVNGRLWHTQTRVARNGRSCRWEGSALELVVDRLAEISGFAPVDWNDQSRVEITAEQKSGTGWFLHALTGDEWLLRLCFRVPKGTFREEDLQQSLAIRSVNDLDELPIYNRVDRVRVIPQKGPFQEVLIDVHWREEIDTPAFSEFLNRATAAYLGRSERQSGSGEDLMPWKVLKKKWHLMRKGFPTNKRVAWNVDVLEKLFGQLEELFRDLDVDWSQKTQVTWRRNGKPFAELQTKRREALFLSLFLEPGQVALGAIMTLGNNREIVPHRSGLEEVRLQMTAAAHIPKIVEFIREQVH